MAWSLRTRVITGALLWTIGLLAVAHVISFSIATRYPHLTYIAHGFSIGLIAILCLVAGFAQVRRALTPFAELRTQLSAVRDGDAHRISGMYPAEVQPLVDDLNQLLEQREQAIARAVARAGDLAHGLKTPLAVITNEAERARMAGQEETAVPILRQIERMRRQVDHHLAQAGATAAGSAAGQRTAVRASAEALGHTLRRLHAGRPLSIEIAADDAHVVAARREDVEEMLGNLLDNACKWAGGVVRLRSAARDGVIELSVEDDGPGLAAPLRDAVLQRGVRADEAAPGSGFGLAIVRDLAELYGGAIALSASALGGVRAVLTLPAADGASGAQSRSRT
jgi:signal transduction histidine kinase